MSRLKDRLRRLKGTMDTESGRSEPPPHEADKLKTVTSVARGNEPASAGQDRNPPGRSGGPSSACTLVENGAGRFMMRERVYPLDASHGLYRLGELEGLYPALTRVTKRYAGMRTLDSHRNLLFFDTETTGLGVGAGNVPFMIGVGFYTHETLTVRQFFVRNPGEERAMLNYFGELTRSFTHLISYNGRTFDWPILKNRCVLNRIPLAERGPEHLDLLYMSRNLWRGSLESCRLGAVEEKRLGIVRHGDIPGAQAPTLYFQYLATGDDSLMNGVFRHNEIDLLTLATLSIHLCRILSGKLDLTGLTPSELFKIGAWLEAVGQPALAGEAFGELRRRDAAAMRPYCARVAAIYKKQKRYDLAVPLWKLAAAAEENTGALRGLAASAIEPLVELAIYYEHHAKRCDKALECVETALNRLERRMALKRGAGKERETVEQLHRRRSRLIMKLNGAADAEPTLFTL